MPCGAAASGSRSNFDSAGKSVSITAPPLSPWAARAARATISGSRW